MIRANHISKSFGPSCVLVDVSFHLMPGEKVLLVGPNGAGKSTLLRIIAGIMTPSQGEVFIPGSGPPARQAERARLVGYVGHQSMLYDDLTVEENLRFFGLLYGMERARSARRTLALIEMAGMEKHRQTPVKGLSQGQQKRISIARAMVHDPGILILDEPFSALDASARSWLGQVLAAKSDKTIVVATHQPERDLPLADRVLVLSGGALVSNETSVGQGESEESHPARPPEELLRPTLLLVWKDLLIEWRSKKKLSAVLLFSFLLVLIGAFAYRWQGDDIGYLPPLLWLVCVFAQLMFLGDVYSHETANGSFDALRISPVSGHQLLAGKLLASLIWVLVVSLAVIAEITFFASTGRLLRLELLGLVLLESVGMLAIGSLFFARKAGGAATSLDLFPIIVSLSVPLLFLSTEISQSVVRDEPLPNVELYYLLLVLYDVFLVIGCSFFYRPLIED